MLNCAQFRECIVKPVLNGLQLYTPVAEELLVATCAQESLGGTYLIQEKGMALGIYQMEPKTHDDIWEKYMPNHSELSYRLMTTCLMSTKPLSKMMLHNLFYATAMARIFYLRCAQALPESCDISALWDYYKKWWNTELGSATKDEFVKNYGLFINGGNHEKAQSKGKQERRAA